MRKTKINNNQKKYKKMNKILRNIKSKHKNNNKYSYLKLNN